MIVAKGISPVNAEGATVSVVNQRTKHVEMHPNSEKLPLILMWSGGKDSAYALWKLLNDHSHEVTALAALITEGYERTKWHGVRTVMMRQQASAIGLPLVEVRVPPNDIIESAEEFFSGVASFFGNEHDQPTRALAWGDIYSLAAREEHQSVCDQAGLAYVAPLWGWSTTDLAQSVIEIGISTTIVQVVLSKFGVNAESFLGRTFDQHLLSDLPEGIDPCGEEGEFHTFAWDGPMFRHPVAFTGDRIARRGDSAWLDIVPS